MAERPDTLHRREDIYRDAIAVIVRDYASDLHVDEVARSIGTSRRQLQRVLAVRRNVTNSDAAHVSRIEAQGANRLHRTGVLRSH